VRDLSLREELSLPWGPGRLLEAGVELHRLQSRVTFRLEGLRSVLQQDGPDGLPTGLDGRAPAHTRGGIWVQDRLQWGEALVVTPGVRLDWSGLARHPTLSPRLGATYALGTFTRLRAALGLYTQSPGYEKLVQSDYVVDQVDLRFERARHAILGLEHDLAPGVTARVEVYHKRFRDLILGRLETEAELADRLRRYDFPEALQGDIPREPRLTSVPTNDGRGRAYGFDLYLSRTGGAASRLTGWASYTFGVARREGYGLVYPFEYDRRHSLSLVGQYRVGPRVSFAATARVASGFPWTPPAGVRVAGEELPDGRIVPERDGRRRLVYEVAPGGRAALNSERLPAFARLDLRAAFRPRGVAGRWEFFAEVINALDRDNVSGFRSTLALDPESDRPSLVLERVGSIPLIPSFGVRFQFD
jgi:hypothetical protein